MSEPNKSTDLAAAKKEIQAMFDMANTKIEELISNAEEKAAGIVSGARQTVVPARVVKQERMVNIKLRKDKERNNADLPVSVNGKTWLLQRGVWTEVPLSVAEVLENADRQEEYAIAYSEGLASAFEEKISKL